MKDPTQDQDQESFWEHVEALRSALLKAFAIIALGSVLSFFFCEPLLSVLTHPYRALQDSDSEQTVGLLIFGPLEGFLIALKVSLWAGCIATSPLWLFVLLRFVMPGLRQQEKKVIVSLLVFSILFFAMGLVVAFVVTIPIANAALFSFNAAIGENLWALAPYLNYTLGLSLANGIAFEGAAILLLLIHYNRISADALTEKRREVIVGMFIAGAVLTPPDVITQCLIVLPLIVSYELAILYARWRN